MLSCELISSMSSRVQVAKSTQGMAYCLILKSKAVNSEIPRYGIFFSSK